MATYNYYIAAATPPLRLRRDWLARRVEGYIRQYALLPWDSCVLVGVSGGRDSLVLLRVLAGLGYWKLTAAHCNFRLRGAASDGDEEFTRAACASLGIDLHLARFDTQAWCEAHAVGVEEGARKLRYEWFAELCRTHGYTRVAVAHHADDQAETMLLNAARGAGLVGLRGMPRQNGIVVRPLLGITRRDIDRWIGEQKMAFREDATNAGEAYARNLLRHRAIPALVRVNNRAVEHMSAASEALEEAQEALIAESERLWGEINSPLAAAGEAIATDDAKAKAHGKLLRFWLRERLMGLGFSPQQAREALRWLDKRHAGREIRAGKVVLYAERHGLWLGLADLQPASARWYEGPGEDDLLTVHEERCGPFADAAALRTYANRGKQIAVLSAERFRYPFVLRCWRAGDTIRPLGMRGRKLVSDVLTDARIASHAKERAEVVECAGAIAWVVGVCVSDDFALRAASERAVILEARGAREE